MDRLEITLDAEEIIRALSTFGDAAQPYVDAASDETADAIVTEAQARFSRSVTSRSGQTFAGIRKQRAPDGRGILVVSERDKFPNLPLWIEFGTKGPGLHLLPAWYYFYPAALLEEVPHLRRIEEALQDAADDHGLGE